MYLDIARFGSRAGAVAPKHTATSPASNHLSHPPNLDILCCSVLRSGEVFEFLNHYLGPVLQRDFGVSEDVQIQAADSMPGEGTPDVKTCSAIVSAPRTDLPGSASRTVLKEIRPASQ